MERKYLLNNWKNENLQVNVFTIVQLYQNLFFTDVKVVRILFNFLEGVYCLENYLNFSCC